jgi:hypothetical protein
LTLLVDFKGDPAKSIVLLQQALQPLRPFLSRVDKKGVFHRGPVTVLISGNKPTEQQLLSGGDAAAGDRFLFLDGRENDIHEEADTTLMPMVSIPWRAMYKHRLVGRAGEYMRTMAAKAHEQGKLLRIWGAPNEESVWRQMLQNNVDLLSIDDHPGFARFAAGGQ